MKFFSPFKKILAIIGLFLKGLFSSVKKDKKDKKKKPLAKKKATPKKPIKKTLVRKRATKVPQEKIYTIVKKKKHPIIMPNRNNEWENLQTFNPGTVYLDNKIHFLYRALGSDYYSRLGYANSLDGFIIDERLPYPVYELGPSSKFTCTSYRTSPSGGGIGGCEDPRIVHVADDDSLYVTYTDFTNGSIRMAVTSIKVDDFLNKRWRWEKASLISPPNQAHKNWVIFPEKINGKFAVLHSISPTISIEYLDSLNFKRTKFIKSSYLKMFREGGWDYWVRGAGPPPLKTDEGWLLFYHAMSKDDFSKYKVGVMMLDLKDPTKILYRSKYPIMIPEECYENDGYKPGVVYLSGAVIREGEIVLHYGGADSYVCVAHTDLNKFLEALKKNDVINFKKSNIKQKKHDIKKI